MSKKWATSIELQEKTTAKVWGVLDLGQDLVMMSTHRQEILAKPTQVRVEIKLNILKCSDFLDEDFAI